MLGDGAAPQGRVRTAAPSIGIDLAVELGMASHQRAVACRLDDRAMDRLVEPEVGQAIAALIGCQQLVMQGTDFHDLGIACPACGQLAGKPLQHRQEIELVGDGRGRERRDGGPRLGDRTTSSSAARIFRASRKGVRDAPSRSASCRPAGVCRRRILP